MGVHMISDSFLCRRKKLLSAIVSSRLSQRKRANIVWEKTFYVRCCRQQLRRKCTSYKGEKNSAWLIKVKRTGQAIYGRNFAS